jgi:hypothetical protein
MRRVDGYMNESLLNRPEQQRPVQRVSSRVPRGPEPRPGRKGRMECVLARFGVSRPELGVATHLPALSGRDRHLRDAQQRAAHAVHDAAPQCERQVWSPRRDASGDALDALRHRHDALQSQTEFHVFAVKWTPDRVPWFSTGKGRAEHALPLHHRQRVVVRLDRSAELHRLEYMAVRVGRQLP